MLFKKNLFTNALNNKDLPAVTSHGKTLTYQDLLDTYYSLAPAMKGFGRVGLYFEKSTEYIKSVFALTLTDEAFIPLDLVSPKERLSYIIEDAEIKIVLTSKKYSKDVLSKLPENVICHYIEDLLEKDQLISIKPSNEMKDEPAYVIYTSGSTGKPKGVEVSFNGLSNVIDQQIEVLEMDKSNFYLYLAISFDASLSDIYCSLMSNSFIHIFDCLKRNAIGLKDYFNKEKITHSDLPPSLLKLLSPNDFTTLKSIIIGGEVADYKSVQDFASVMKVINVYGPTEATICTSMVVCDNKWSKPLIGKALENVIYKIESEDGSVIVAPNVVGQLLIGGCQLALRYLGDNPENNSRFKDVNGERLYETGDLVMYNEDGDIEFKGRVDRQIKYHGQLICLEEIESAINSLPEISSVTVLFKNEKIYGYYEGSISEKEIRVALKPKIPSYMIPSFIINKDIPKTVTGKNDGKLLATEDSSDDEVLVILNLFKKILKLPNDVRLSKTDSFISDLNADSLNFIELHLALQGIGLNLSYDYLIENNSADLILNYKDQDVVVDTIFLVKEFDALELPLIERKVEKQAHKNILLTGSTGFLGSTLLKALLSKNEIEHVFCVVRGRNTESAEKRLLSALKFSNIELTAIEFSKIRVVVGDVSKPELGMTKSVHDKLINLVDNVYHCAAEVNNIKSYSQLFNSNVQSTIEISNFIFNGRDKNLHYASTLSVYVSSDSLLNSVFDEVPLKDDGHRLYSGYAQTKWLSEYYLNALSKKGGNIYTYRFGLLTPSSSNMVVNEKTFLTKTIQDFNEIGVIPKSNVDLSMDITPVDIAVQTMLKSSINEKADIFHVSLNYQLRLRDIAEHLEIERNMDVEEWFELYSKYSVAQYMTDINTVYTKQHNMNLFETTNVSHFETNNIKKYLKNNALMQVFLYDYIDRLFEKIKLI